MSHFSDDSPELQRGAFPGLAAKRSGGDCNVVLSGARACAVHALTLESTAEEEMFRTTFSSEGRVSWFSAGPPEAWQSSGARRAYISHLDGGGG